MGTISAYRLPSVTEFIESWFTVLEPDFKQESRRDLFLTYTAFVINQRRYDLVLNYSDFSRALYSLGIVDVVGNDEVGYYFDQLAGWRPSLDQVKRFEV